LGNKAIIAVYYFIRICTLFTGICVCCDRNIIGLIRSQFEVFYEITGVTFADNLNEVGVNAGLDAVIYIITGHIGGLMAFVPNQLGTGSLADVATAKYQC